MNNFSTELRSQWGKLGGRPRLHLNVAEKQKAYRLRKNQIKLVELRKKELLKPVNERLNWVLNSVTGRINRLKKI